MDICPIWFSQLSWPCVLGAGCGNKGRVAGQRSNNGDIQICDGTVEVEDKVLARMLPLSVPDGGESPYLLFKEYLGATV